MTQSIKLEIKFIQDEIKEIEELWTENLDRDTEYYCRGKLMAYNEILLKLQKLLDFSEGK